MTLHFGRKFLSERQIHADWIYFYEKLHVFVAIIPMRRSFDHFKYELTLQSYLRFCMKIKIIFTVLQQNKVAGPISEAKRQDNTALKKRRSGGEPFATLRPT